MACRSAFSCRRPLADNGYSSATYNRVSIPVTRHFAGRTAEALVGDAE